MTELEDLSPEQQDVVNLWGQGLAVTAGAGSGKTTTLVIKCQELLKRKPNARFAAVSFTERSTSDIKEKLSSRISLSGSGGALSGHWVMTIHGLCAAVIKEYPNEAGLDGDESMLSENESRVLWEKALESLWFDELPQKVQEALDRLLERETKNSLFPLLLRVRSLYSFGIMDSLSASSDVSSRDLANLSQFVISKYERIKRRKGVLDFDDLERGALKVLEFDHTRRSFHKRFDLVLVDEFQDTNPVQAKIIRAFVKSDCSNLIVVGDPKQSIYRFRDADVTVFENFCSQLPVKKSLTWNFRSRPEIINFCNSVCEETFKTSDLNYEPLVAKRQADDNSSSVSLLTLQQPVELGYWLKAQRKQGKDFSEFALLLRKIRGNEKWLTALTAVGIPLAVGSGGFFWEDPRIRELTAFLKWWDNPRNLLSAGIFFRAPWVGINDQLLDEWFKRPDELTESFFSSGSVFAKALAPFRSKIVRPGELLLKLLINQNVENEIAVPLLGLWHRCEEFSLLGMDFHGVVGELSLAVEEVRRERDVPPPKNEGQLRVLTLHSSKGLEFPKVILLDFPEKPLRSPNSPLLFWDREKGAYLGSRDEDGERSEKDPIEKVWREEEVRKNLAESKRLFYVALTRAQESLHLVYADSKCEDMVEDLSKNYTRDYWRGWIDASRVKIIEEEVFDLFDDNVSASGTVIPVISKEPLSLKPSIKRPRHSVTEWNALERCPRYYEWSYVRPLIAENDIVQLENVDSAVSMTQRELGSLVHKYLETGEYEGLRKLEETVGSARFNSKVLIDWAERSDLMKRSLPESGRLIWTELGFEVPYYGEVIVGSIDRLVFQSGIYTVIDFKITVVPKTTAELIDAYKNQIELYALAVARMEGLGENYQKHLRGMIVNISGQKVTEHTIQIEAKDFRATIKEAREILNGKKGEGMRSSLCRGCDFRQNCFLPS